MLAGSTHFDAKCASQLIIELFAAALGTDLDAIIEDNAWLHGLSYPLPLSFPLKAYFLDGLGSNPTGSQFVFVDEKTTLGIVQTGQVELDVVSQTLVPGQWVVGAVRITAVSTIRSACSRIYRELWIGCLGRPGIAGSRRDRTEGANGTYCRGCLELDESLCQRTL